MRIVAFITQTSVIDQILAPLRGRAARESPASRTRVAREAAEPAIDAGPRAPGRVTRPTPVRRRPDRPDRPDRPVSPAPDAHSPPLARQGTAAYSTCPD